MNAIALTSLGLTSTLLGGIICDKSEKEKKYRKHSWILMLANYLSIPLIGIACWTSNFYIAMLAVSAKIFVSGCNVAPTLTMMQNTVSPEDSGLVVSAYSIFTSIGKTISPLFFNQFAKYLGAATNPRKLGLMILIATSFGLLTSNIFMFKAGKEYTKLMQEKDKMLEDQNT